VTLLARRDTAS